MGESQECCRNECQCSLIATGVALWRDITGVGMDWRRWGAGEPREGEEEEWEG